MVAAWLVFNQIAQSNRDEIERQRKNYMERDTCYHGRPECECGVKAEQLEPTPYASGGMWLDDSDYNSIDDHAGLNDLINHLQDRVVKLEKRIRKLEKK